MVRTAIHFFALILGLSAPVAIGLGATAWMGPTYTLTVAHITGTGQSTSGYLDLSLEHDTTCDVTVHPLRDGGEVLTKVGGGATLTTSYMVTGNALETQDTTWVSSTDFRNRRYHVKTTGPTTDVLRLWVQGESPTHQALPAGDYTTSFALTVTW